MLTTPEAASPDSGSRPPFPPRTQFDKSTPRGQLFSAGRIRSYAASSLQGQLPAPPALSLSSWLKVPESPKSTVSAAEQQRLWLRADAQQPVRRRPPLQRLPTPSSALLPQLTLSSDPGLSGRTRRPLGQRPGDPLPRLLLPEGRSLTCPGPPEEGGRLHEAPTPLNPPPPRSSARCAPAPAGRATLEVPRRSERRPSPRPGHGPLGPRRTAASGGKERVSNRFRDIRRHIGPRARTSTPRLPPGVGAGPAHGPLLEEEYVCFYLECVCAPPSRKALTKEKSFSC
ncbi:WAS/WASL-interacting protein family member 2-like [Nycticebus coucang]|uniref:WAS/WASL-interacting protein family member 2-like n=1 Tax=Nycticebus coucang TaxID=9470 RepID=UPI00234C8C6D|nr:WAS/WASL-interacting protein family member 2-like [Nycticebus coucang]